MHPVPRSLLTIAKAKPKILPFELPSKASAGDSVAANCIARGSSPIRFEWLKDSHVLSKETATISVTDYMSSIFINLVQATHAGNYTCITSNDFGSDSFTARLRVQSECASASDAIRCTRTDPNKLPGAPQWLVRPNDVRVREGEDSADVRCEASGDPEPQVVWKRLTGTSFCRFPLETEQRLVSSSQASPGHCCLLRPQTRCDSATYTSQTADRTPAQRPTASDRTCSRSSTSASGVGFALLSGSSARVARSFSVRDDFSQSVAFCPLHQQSWRQGSCCPVSHCDSRSCRCGCRSCSFSRFSSLGLSPVS